MPAATEAMMLDLKVEDMLEFRFSISRTIEGKSQIYKRNILIRYCDKAVKVFAFLDLLMI